MRAAGLVLIGLSMSVLAVSTASAQQAPAPTPPSNPPVAGTYNHVAPLERPFYSREIDAWRNAQTIRAQVKAKTSPEQWRRAQQAADLINANQCANAYKLAIIEQDQRLAKAIKSTCSGRTRG